MSQVKNPALLHEGPWIGLLQQAFRLIDDFQAKGGLSDPFWTFGGGTVLMLRYHHRKSKDIDIIVQPLRTHASSRQSSCVIFNS